MLNNKNRAEPFTRIGFIGTGVMGKSIVGHFLTAGYQMNIYSRTKSKAQELIGRGARWNDSVAEVAKNSDIIFTMVGFPADVEDVYFGDGGIIANAAKSSTLIDMTTTKPSLAKKIYECAKNMEIESLDAPVSGGDKGAREATLSIMIGGDRIVFDRMLPILQLVGSKIVYQGNAGAGQHTKMANQIAIAGTILGVCEALSYAQKEGLNPFNVLSSIESGAAGSWTMSNLGPKMLDGDFAPGFYVKHIVKDLAIAIEESDLVHQELPGLKLTKSLFEKLISLERGESGTQALFTLYGN